MMDYIKIPGFCLSILVLLVLLRQYNPAAAILTAMACCIAITAFAIKGAAPILDFVTTLTQLTEFQYLKCVLKAVAIALVTQITEDLCIQSGQPALAGHLELAGKIAVFTVTMPLFSVLTDTLLSLLG